MSLNRTKKHAHLYYHIFSTEEPDGFYPNSCVRVSDTSPEKLTVYSMIKEHSSKASYARDYKYHGMFMKLDNFGRFHFKGICPEVERAFLHEKKADEYGI